MERIRVNKLRRKLLRTSLFGALGAVLGAEMSGCGSGPSSSGVPPSPESLGFGPLLAVDPNGLRLPAGFVSRIVARSGESPILGSGYVWHSAPDGGATFPVNDGGWVYVSNSEVGGGMGGVGALRFDSGGNLISAYSILDGTSVNCAGGPTPWGSWLSCEEFPDGYVWECDPLGGYLGQCRKALGKFQHEAAAVDPRSGYIYLTEDRQDGCFYRFIPDSGVPGSMPNLEEGELQVAQVMDALEGAVTWHALPDPDGVMVATRHQVSQSSTFSRGEGLWYDEGFVYMATTGDNRIWMYDTTDERISIIYDDNWSSQPILTGVDNLTVSSKGDIYVAEDRSIDSLDAQLVLLSRDGQVIPVVQLFGHIDPEIAGPAFDPSGSRLYFSSQKGTTGRREDGVTFEVTGPFV